MNTFPKSEKLCGQMRIADLYKTGRRFVVWPLRVTVKEVEAEETRVLIWAPKSLFKHAVDRNHLRRLMREAYRLEKTRYADSPKRYYLAFNYMEKEQHPLPVIQRAVRKALKRVYEREETH